MKILVLAPHPFYQERGTPIDVMLVLRVLSERPGTKVDLLVYGEGIDVELPNLSIHRILPLKLTKGVRPGFSLKKLICDAQMVFKAWILVRANQYTIIHAGEEAVFIAMLFKFVYRIPYAYDLDSSIAQQLVEKKPLLRVFAFFFNWLEKKAIQNAVVNFPVCNALAALCKGNGSIKTVTLHDISQLKNPDAPSTGRLKKEIEIDKLVLVYIGNLEEYQGVDLLLDSFKIACNQLDEMDLVIIGGRDDDIQFYRQKAQNLRIADRTHFLGPKPFDQLDEYLAEADILVCPRIRGVNTPMKIFPYLHSGKPVLATDLYTHNQLLTKNEAYLAPADPQGFGNGIIALVENKTLRKTLGRKGKEFVEKEHTYEAHRKRLLDAYRWIESFLKKRS